MKCINFIYSSEKHLTDLIEANKLTPEKEYLIRIHTCIHNPDNIMPFVNIIASKLPNAKIIGSSTCGVIYEGQIMEDCCLVSITEFNNVSLNTFMLPLSGDDGADLTGYALADSVREQFRAEDPRFILAFFSRPFIKVTDFVDSLNNFFSDMQIIGGVANTADGTPEHSWLYQSFVFNESSVSNDAVVCAGINSHTMSVFSDIIYATEPVGKSYTITDADGMIIRTVEGINAVEWYQDLLGVDLSGIDQSNSTSIFPLIKPDYHNIPWAVAYSPQNEKISVFSDEPYPVMFVPSEARVGDKIRISYSSIQKTIDVCESVCENICNHPAEVLFGYSCVSRRDMFSNCASWELMPFKKTNLCGALLSGELGNIENFNLYCNYSFTIAALSESNSHIRLDIKALEQNSNSLIDNHIQIMEFLLKNSSDNNSSMDDQQNEIKSSLFIDDDTGLGNITKFLFDCNLGNFDKICMITIKNESLLKAFLSESKFLIYFNRFHKAIMDFVQTWGYSCYIYKKTSLILTAAPDISDSEFLEMLQALQNNLSNFKFSSYVPVTDFAVVMHEDDMIKKAELALVRMRNKNQSFLVYTAELGLEQFNAQKMKMITILNDAISNNRVIPFFQGIHDNHSKDIKMYEALMRIEDEEGNIYTPYLFMNIAKEYGYYSDISYMMINKVLRIFRDSSDKVTINLNISDIYDYKITHSIFDFLKNAPHPENYIFELTETEEIEDYQVIFEFSEKIHEVGGSIAIDDFGSGFSNILNILKIQSDYIKIDGEIIKNISSDIYALEFLEMISTWANKHCKEIIAEFVENDSIQSIVEQNNIRFSQGYLYSKPERLFDE